MEAVGKPGCGIDIEIPADGVGPIGGKRLKGIHRISLGLAHLLPVLILYQTKHNDILIGCFVKEQGGFRHQRVEPASCLIHGLRDELRRELLLEQLFIFKRIMVLRKGHGSGIKPAVDHLRHSLHRPAALGASAGDLVDVRPVKLHGPGRRIAA